MYCEPKVYGTYEDPLAIVDSFETFLLLAGYLGYIILCAVYARIMDKCCPSYGGADQIGFAEMGAATTSFDAQDKTNRPSVDGFEAYKKNRQLQNRRTVVARQLVGSILRGEAEYSELIGKCVWQLCAVMGRHSNLCLRSFVTIVRSLSRLGNLGFS